MSIYCFPVNLTALRTNIRQPCTASQCTYQNAPRRRRSEGRIEGWIRHERWGATATYEHKTTFPVENKTIYKMSNRAFKTKHIKI